METAHNLRIETLIRVLSQFECKFVDAQITDDLTIKFRPSAYQGEEPPSPPEETDVNRLIV